MSTMPTRLDAYDEVPAVAALRALTCDLLHPVPGTVVVDVGTGTARAVPDLSRRGVHAVGVDADPAVVAAARKRYPGADLRSADALRLPFADGTVAGYRADKVLHGIADPAAAVAEARRILRPGGRIVLAGHDWDTVVVEADDAALTRQLVHARADAVIRPRVARAFRNLLADAGFTAVDLHVETLVFTGAGALPIATSLAAGGAEDWLAEQRRRAAADRALVAVPVFVASATAPAT